LFPLFPCFFLKIPPIVPDSHLFCLFADSSPLVYGVLFVFFFLSTPSYSRAIVPCSLFCQVSFLMRFFPSPFLSAAPRRLTWAHYFVFLFTLSPLFPLEEVNEYSRTRFHRPLSLALWLLLYAPHLSGVDFILLLFIYSRFIVPLSPPCYSLPRGVPLPLSV